MLKRRLTASAVSLDAVNRPLPQMAPPDGFVSALERPLTIAEVAGHYRVSERTIRRRIKDGTLHKELGQGRLVRISVEQLRRLAEKPY